MKNQAQKFGQSELKNRDSIGLQKSSHREEQDKDLDAIEEMFRSKTKSDVNTDK